MAGAIDNQGMGRKKSQLMARLAVLAEGAAQGHQSIANQPVGQQAALGGSGRGDGIAVDAAGEGKRLAGIPHGHGGVGWGDRLDHLAVAQILDTRAAQPCQSDKRFRVGAGGQQLLQPVSRVFQRCAVVWCAEKDQVGKVRRPGEPGHAGMVAGAAGNQSPHAVAHYRYLFEVSRPVGEQLFQQQGQCLPVLCNGQSRVVAHVKRLIAQRVGKLLPMIDRFTLIKGLPLQIVHAQAMDHQQHPSLAGQICRHGLPVEGFTLIAQGHGGGEGVMALDQSVPHHAVEGGDQCRAFGRLGNMVHWRGRRQPGQQPVDAAAEGIGRAVNPLVDQPGDPGCLPLIPPLDPHTAEHRLMYRFGDLYRGRQRQGQQLRQLADIRDMPGGGGLFCGVGHGNALWKSIEKGSPGGRHINQLARFGTGLPVPESVIREQKGLMIDPCEAGHGNGGENHLYCVT